MGANKAPAGHNELLLQLLLPETQALQFHRRCLQQPALGDHPILSRALPLLCDCRLQQRRGLGPRLYVARRREAHPSAACSIVSSSSRAGAVECLFVPAADFRTISTAAPEHSTWFTAFIVLSARITTIGSDIMKNLGRLSNSYSIAKLQVYTYTLLWAAGPITNTWANTPPQDE